MYRSEAFPQEPEGEAAKIDRCSLMLEAPGGLDSQMVMQNTWPEMALGTPRKEDPCEELTTLQLSLSKVLDDLAPSVGSKH